jgi:hypothetical protein
MPRKRRGWQKGACYHITHRCHNREFLFHSGRIVFTVIFISLFIVQNSLFLYPPMDQSPAIHRSRVFLRR